MACFYEDDPEKASHALWFVLRSAVPCGATLRGARRGRRRGGCAPASAGPCQRSGGRGAAPAEPSSCAFGPSRTLGARGSKVQVLNPCGGALVLGGAHQGSGSTASLSRPSRRRATRPAGDAAPQTTVCPGQGWVCVRLGRAGAGPLPGGQGGGGDRSKPLQGPRIRSCIAPSHAGIQLPPAEVGLGPNRAGKGELIVLCFVCLPGSVAGAVGLLQSLWLLQSRVPGSGRPHQQLGFGSLPCWKGGGPRAATGYGALVLAYWSLFLFF